MTATLTERFDWMRSSGVCSPTTRSLIDDAQAEIEALQARLDAAEHGDTPTIWIQWKGTPACFDFWCECVNEDPDEDFGHGDVDYGAYAIQCERCGRKYDMPQTLRLLPFSGKWEPKTVGGFDA